MASSKQTLPTLRSLARSAESVQHPQYVTARTKRWVVILSVLGALLVGALIISLVIGSVNIPLKDILSALFGGETERASWKTIILNFRLPKALTALLAGSGLAVSGLILQTLFRNPLADSYVLGVSSGASLGVALVILVLGTTGATFLTGLSFISDLGIAAAACLGAGFVMVIVLIAAQRVKNTMMLLILGLMISYLTNALVSIMMHFSIQDRIQTYVNWTFGSFASVTWGQMPIFALVCISALVIAFLCIKPLNALLLGEAYARTLGVDIRHVRRLLIASASLLAGGITAFCGPIAFIGIAVPHVARAVMGTADHRVLVPATALIGGAFALMADVISQMPGTDIVLPLNAITALIGAPIVVWVILRRQILRSLAS